MSQYSKERPNSNLEMGPPVLRVKYSVKTLKAIRNTTQSPMQNQMPLNINRLTSGRMKRRVQMTNQIRGFFRQGGAVPSIGEMQITTGETQTIL